MPHRADTPISQRLMTSLHSILDTTSLTIADIASMMGSDKNNLRRLAYGRVQKLYFSGFVERLELTLADIGYWISENGHNGITHYVRNSARKYSLQAVAQKHNPPKKKVKVQKKAKRFATGAHFTGRSLAERKADLNQSVSDYKADLNQSVSDYIARLQSTDQQMQKVLKESAERIKKHERINTFMNIFVILDIVLITAVILVSLVQAFRS